MESTAAAHGFSTFATQGPLFRGWALAVQGQVEEGIAQLRQGLRAVQDIGVKLGRPYWLAQLAEAYGKAEQPDEGLAILEEAVELLNIGDCSNVNGVETYFVKFELQLHKKVDGSKHKRELLTVVFQRPNLRPQAVYPPGHFSA